MSLSKMDIESVSDTMSPEMPASRTSEDAFLSYSFLSTSVETPENIPNYSTLRVILPQTAAGLKPPSGGYRGNYSMLHALAEHGHEVAQLCWAFQKDINMAIAELKLAQKPYDLNWGTVQMVDDEMNPVDVTWWTFTDVRGIHCIALNAETMLRVMPNEVLMEHASHWIETDELPARIASYVQWMKKQFTEFNATHVVFNDALVAKLTSTMPHFLNHAARVEVVHTAEQLARGPYKGGIPGSATKSENAEQKLWEQLDGIITVSEATQKYALEHAGLQTKMLHNHAWVYQDADTHDLPRRRYNYARQRVAMINPAYVKGFDIFLEMAKSNRIRNLGYDLTAWSSWGSNDDIRNQLKAQDVRILESEKDMEPVWDTITVLVVPSLWFEAWGIVVTQAQLRGIVVLSSNAGAIPEAKQFVDPIIPVNVITGTERDASGNYVIPKQDAGAWIEELDRLMTDRAYYEACAERAYGAACAWVEGADVRGHEKYLLGLKK